MNKFGVCRYEFDDYNPKIKNLEIFNTYEEAYNRYMTLLETADKTNTFINKDLQPVLYRYFTTTLYVCIAYILGLTKEIDNSEIVEEFFLSHKK